MEAGLRIKPNPKRLENRRPTSAGNTRVPEDTDIPGKRVNSVRDKWGRKLPASAIAGLMLRETKKWKNTEM